MKGERPEAPFGVKGPRPLTKLEKLERGLEKLDADLAGAKAAKSTAASRKRIARLETERHSLKNEIRNVVGGLSRGRQRQTPERNAAIAADYKAVSGKRNEVKKLAERHSIKPEQVRRIAAKEEERAKAARRSSPKAKASDAVPDESEGRALSTAPPTAAPRHGNQLRFDENLYAAEMTALVSQLRDVEKGLSRASDAIAGGDLFGAGDWATSFRDRVAEIAGKLQNLKKQLVS